MSNICCASGTIHVRTEPTGVVEKVHGYDCYVSYPPIDIPAKGIIVFIPDGFGWTFPNNRLLNDAYARSGFISYLPEFMDGHALPAFLMENVVPLESSDTGLLPKIAMAVPILWHLIPFKIWTRPAIAQPRIWDFCEKLRASQEGQSERKPIGAAGFCWGGKFVFLLCGSQGKGKDGRCLIDAGFTAHPSGLTVPQDAHDIQIPISVAAAENDMILDMKQTNEIMQILEKKSEKAEPQCEFRLYKGARHGFAVRGDEGEEAMNRMDEARDQLVEWFTACFSKGSQT